MSKKFYQSKEFIELQNKWYDKLTATGFSDLEWLDKNTGLGQNSPFLRGSTTKFKHLDTSELKKRAEYFTAALDFSRQHNFKTLLHKYTWELYCEGVSYRKMIPMFRRRGFKFVPSIFWISTELNKLKKHFQLWQLKQPNEVETTAEFMESNGPIGEY